MKNSKPDIKTVQNQKRKKAKLRRNKGIGAMEKTGATEVQWCRDHDPLFKIKGIERHKKIKGI